MTSIHAHSGRVSYISIAYPTAPSTTAAPAAAASTAVAPGTTPQPGASTVAASAEATKRASPPVAAQPRYAFVAVLYCSWLLGLCCVTDSGCGCRAPTVGDGILSPLAGYELTALYIVLIRI